ncbi:MAG: hypothetical protein ABIT58_07200 [Ferruginibacter sp.]
MPYNDSLPDGRTLYSPEINGVLLTEKGNNAIESGVFVFLNSKIKRKDPGNFTVKAK